MELTDEVLKTQFYDKVEDYKTLEYNEHNCKLQKYEENKKNHYKIFFDFETITSETTHIPYLCWSYMMIYRKNLMVLIIVLLIC